MKTQSAMVRKAPGKWEVVELDLADPRPGEIQIKLAATGLCHTDDHVAKGDMAFETYPVVGGHEGAGVVVAVGANSPGFEVGDHVVTLGTAGCGRCRPCVEGAQNLCDMNAGAMSGASPEDPTHFRFSLDGHRVGQLVGLGTFSEYTTVSTISAVKIPEAIPLDVACLVGCGVTTGWGAAVHSAQVRPGHTVIVMGVGGIGINAVQGAAIAGAAHVIAVDPVEFKQRKAVEFGATHAVSSIDEAIELVHSMTNGQGADAAIVSVGITRQEHVSKAVEAIRKGGVAVIVGLGSTDTSLDVSIAEMTVMQKRIQGSLYGASSPSGGVLRLLELYSAGKLKLDELISSRYSLDDINQGYDDMHAGTNIRGVVEFH